MNGEPSKGISPPLTVAQALSLGIITLTDRGVPDPRSSAEVLLKEILYLPDRSGLYSQSERILTEEETLRFHTWIEERGKRKPVAYIIGKKSFYDLELSVGPGVLIPRPETELIVETALELAPTLPEGAIADLGSGSGAIAIVLSRMLERTVVAVEKSPSALFYLKKNLERYGGRVAILRSDFTSALKNESYALLISNPPYLSQKEWEDRLPELTFEPEEALVSGPTGLEAISAILSDARRVLKPGGILLCEIGYNQAERIRNFTELWGTPTFLKDLRGYERAFWVRKTG